MTVAARPQWIAKMYSRKTGRDYFGLGSASSDQSRAFPSARHQRPDDPSPLLRLLHIPAGRVLPAGRSAHSCDRPAHGVTGSIVGANKTAGLAHSQLITYDTITD